MNNKLYFKCLYYLNILNHKDKSDALNEYFKEKNIINFYQNNQVNTTIDNTNKTNNNEACEKKIQIAKALIPTIVIVIVALIIKL